MRRAWVRTAALANMSLIDQKPVRISRSDMRRMAVFGAVSLAAELNDEASSSSLGSHKIFSARVPAAWSSALNLGFTKPQSGP